MKNELCEEEAGLLDAVVGDDEGLVVCAAFVDPNYVVLGFSRSRGGR